MFRDVLLEVVAAVVVVQAVEVVEDETLHQAVVVEEQRMEVEEDVRGAVVARVEVEEGVTGVGGASEEEDEEEDVVEGNHGRIQIMLTHGGGNSSHYFLSELLAMIMAMT
jgi:hypothetical protein